MQEPTLLELLQAGVHFGHQSSRWHPKMQPYIFGERNGIHIIDLERTKAKLNEALTYVRDLVARGGTILFLGTKRQAAEIIKKNAEDCGMPYVSTRWLGGTLTNFNAVMGLIRRHKDLKSKQASGELEKYTKKEQSQFMKEMAEMETKVGGILGLTRIPDAIFIVDLKKEKTALAEATVKKVPVVALVDTNVNPEEVAYPIPSNDDAVKTIELMTGLVAAAVRAGQASREAQQAAAPKEEVKPLIKSTGEKTAVA